MNYPLIALVLLSTLSLGMSIATHGEERKPENAWATIIAYGVTMVLLYYAFK